MEQWLRFLFGTPRRTLTTAAAIFVIAVLVNPRILHHIFAQLMTAINPLIGPIVQILIIFFVLRFMFRSLTGGNGKKK